MSKNEIYPSKWMDQADILSSFGQEISLSGLRIQIVRVTHLRKAKTPWIIPDHAHVNWEFHYVLSGDATITTVGRDVQVQNGDLYITPPYYTHRQVCNVVSLEEYCIECNILSSDHPETGTAQRQVDWFMRNRDLLISRAFPASPLMKLLFSSMNQALTAKEGYSEVYVEGLLLMLLSGFIDTAYNQCSGSKTDQELRHDHSALAVCIKNYLDANLCNNITAKDIADVFYFSPRQINRLFMAQFHTSPTQYLCKLRMNTAVQLMKNTTLPFSEIALKCGFSGYQQMLRTLKNNGYSTPMAIRQSAAEEPPESVEPT